MPPPPDRPVARLRTPADLAAVVPHLLGFPPERSLVVCCLSGHPARLGLVLRVDLPAEEDVPDVVEHVAGTVLRSGAQGALVLVHDARGEREELPHAGLQEALGAALEERGVAVVRSLLVGEGRTWSYDCADACCPPEGVEVPAAVGDAETAVAARRALDGQALLPSRAALEQSLLPGPGQSAAAPALGPALAAAVLELGGTSRADAARLVTGLVRAACRARADGAAGLTAGTAGLLLVASRDRVVRDALLPLALEPEEPAALVAVLVELVQWAGVRPEQGLPGPAPADLAGACALLAACAHVLGQGPLAGIALERGLAAVPDHALAALLDALLRRAVGPERVRRLLAGVSDELEERFRDGGGRWAEDPWQGRDRVGGQPSAGSHRPRAEPAPPAEPGPSGAASVPGRRRGSRPGPGRRT
ncbi:uncharacterized protein DUF4192 [Motilibacter rhizosphaerae]|uniref:Uncharacterized protein DUF4192 n=1 Tax=Motilibacter rhizosphaerae TaxID=598652 RepID=A0A4Q7NNS9_9ACTN|nr:DUF4192 domain-containing protein [Motilibacter rhizosphaerae]RZS86823.1 uncharacterized protein DUF4192 [Motilibacter rhizosphaerae]